MTSTARWLFGVVWLLLVAGCGDDAVIDLSSGGIDGAPDAADGSLASCTNDDACEPPVPHCDESSNVCVECRADSDCGEGTCEPTSKTCVECTNGDQCEDDEVCDTTRWRCVQCIGDEACSEPGTSCDPLSGTCARGCTTHADCAEEDAMWCLPASGFCVQCITSADCDSAETCDPVSHLCD